MRVPPPSKAALPKGTRSKATWLVDPPNPVPAQTAETRYRPAPAKVQAIADLATKMLAQTSKATAVARKAQPHLPAVRRAQTSLRVACEYRRRADVAKTRPDQRQRQREHRSAETRRTASSSSTSSSDPGGGSDEPEPAHPRVCAATRCSNPVDGRKAYCGTELCDRARARERQRKRRNSNLTVPERDRLTAARVAGYVGHRAFADPGEHSLSFLWKYGLAEGRDPGELGAILYYRARRAAREVVA
jgi:hypothetical protein